MKIAVSPNSCHPLRKAARAQEGGLGGKCAGCGIEVPVGLEWHELPAPKGKTRRRVKLCPICHCSQHLDTAGILEAGTMVWLPEIEQQQLSMLCHVIFAAVQEQKNGALDEQSPQHAQVERLRGLYQTFLSRAAGIVTLFGARNSSINAASPALVAQHIRRVLDEKKISLVELNKKLDGLRFLPSPKAFEAFNQVAAKAILDRYPLTTWMSLVPESSPADRGEYGSDQAFEHAHLNAGEVERDMAEVGAEAAQ